MTNNKNRYFFINFTFTNGRGSHSLECIGHFNHEAVLEDIKKDTNNNKPRDKDLDLNSFVITGWQELTKSDYERFAAKRNDQEARKPDDC